MALSDNFDADTSTRWTDRLGASPAHVWDGTNFEMDVDCSVGNIGIQYSSAGPGSIEHEAQVTYKVGGAIAQPSPGVAVRMRNDATTEWYAAYIDRETNRLEIHRRNAAGNWDSLATLGITVANNDFVTVRLRAAGAVGAAVVLDAWYLNHGSSKPSDPGWIGATADLNVTDAATTDTVRHDQAEHAYCGVSGKAGGFDYDTQHDFWKARTIAEASGGGVTAAAVLIAPTGFA